MGMREDIDKILQESRFGEEVTPEERVCQFLARILSDPRWLGCAISQFVLPTGAVVYSAAIVCNRCRAIHQQVVVPDPTHGFLVAMPTPLEEGE